MRRLSFRFLVVLFALAALPLAQSCDNPSMRDDPHVSEGLRRFDEAFREGRAYNELVALLNDARRMRGAADAALGIAERRYMIVFVYERPVHEVEAALRERLMFDDDPVYRSIAAGAAYARYPQLAPYFDATVAELQAMPRTPTVDSALEAARRVRERVERYGGSARDLW